MKEGLVKIINNIFIPLGFKQRGNFWTQENDYLIKTIDLQKSDYSNLYYINYGYTIKKVPLNDLKRHIFYRINSQTEKGDLLDFENDIPLDLRESGLSQLVKDQIVKEFSIVNNENDLLNQIKKLPTLNTVPLVVKDYFGIPRE
mgnify:CR=1 FL=1